MKKFILGTILALSLTACGEKDYSGTYTGVYGDFHDTYIFKKTGNNEYQLTEKYKQLNTSFPEKTKIYTVEVKERKVYVIGDLPIAYGVFMEKGDEFLKDGIKYKKQAK